MTNESVVLFHSILQRFCFEMLLCVILKVITNYVVSKMSRNEFKFCKLPSNSHVTWMLWRNFPRSICMAVHLNVYFDDPSNEKRIHFRRNYPENHNWITHQQTGVVWKTFSTILHVAHVWTVSGMNILVLLKVKLKLFRTSNRGWLLI